MANTPAKLYMWRGKEYTMQELADLCGVAYDTMRKRMWMTKGDVEQATAAPKGAAKLHPYNGEMLTISQISRITGIPAQRIYNRIHKGWSLEEAAQTHTCGMDTWRARRAIRERAVDLAASNEREQAVEKIARQIITGALAQWDLRCISPEIEYAFTGDELLYSIIFNSKADACTATLAASFAATPQIPVLTRRYSVIGAAIKEVEPV